MAMFIQQCYAAYKMKTLVEQSTARKTHCYYGNSTSDFVNIIFRMSTIDFIDAYTLTLGKCHVNDLPAVLL